VISQVCSRKDICPSTTFTLSGRFPSKPKLIIFPLAYFVRLFWERTLGDKLGLWLDVLSVMSNH